MKYLLLYFYMSMINTSSSNALECGDLFEIYLEKISNIEFVECIQGSHQTVLEATYKVPGKNSKKIEKLLIKKYGLGKLTFKCCGWESKKAYIQLKELSDIDSNYTLEISMFGNAERVDDFGEFYLELNRRKVDFYITIKILDV